MRSRLKYSTLEHETMIWTGITTVIKQKGESQNRCFKKISTPNFPKNEHFLPLDRHTYVICLPEIPVLRSKKPYLCMIFQEKHFCHILLNDQISLSGCLNFLRYWALCVLYLSSIFDVINFEINHSFFLKPFC